MSVHNIDVDIIRHRDRDMVSTYVLGNLDDTFRFMLFGLECALDVELDACAVERLYRHCALENKAYLLYQDTATKVTARVDAYEPGTAWLDVETQKAVSPPLCEIASRAHSQALRMHRLQNERP